MSGFEVPTVDISSYVAGGSGDQRAETARRIDQACREVGFIQVVGHGIYPSFSEDLAAAMDDFFAQSPQQKAALIRPPVENRGYTPPKSESLALSAGVQSETRMNDFFEAFNVGSSASDHPEHHLDAAHYAENTWPAIAGFEAAVDAWRAETGRVARTMVRIFEDALGLDRGWFDSIAATPIEVLRMNNYALSEGLQVEVEDDLIGMGEHTDFGIVTILWADQVRGL